MPKILGFNKCLAKINQENKKASYINDYSFFYEIPVSKEVEKGPPSCSIGWQ